MVRESVAPSRASSLYFVHPLVDFTLVGGLSIFTFFFLINFHTGERTPEVYNLAAMLVWIVNWPHFSATLHRLYSSVNHTLQYPVTSFVIPWVVAAGAVGSFLEPVAIAPYFVKLYLIWSPYHFSGQTLGVSLLYSRRAGIQFPEWARKSLSIFIFCTFIMGSLASEISGMPIAFYGVQVPTLGVPAFFRDVTQVVMYVSAFAFFGYWLWTGVRQRRWIPAIVVLPAIAQFFWFVLGASVPAFNEFVPFFHSLQYLLFAWHINLAENVPSNSPQFTPGLFVFRQSTIWLAINLVGGAVLFHFLPDWTATFSGESLTFSTAIILAAVQLHHFFVDGVIWKLRRQSVMSPLMMSFKQLQVQRTTG